MTTRHNLLQFLNLLQEVQDIWDNSAIKKEWLEKNIAALPMSIQESKDDFLPFILRWK